MGNASGRQDGEGTSGVKKNGYEEERWEQQSMELGQGEAHVSYRAHGGNVYLDPMVQSSLPHPHPSPRAHLQTPAMFTSQIAMAPSPRPGDLMQVQSHAVEHNMTYHEEVGHEKKEAVMIIWSYGGKKVAVTGSWDNWETVDPLWRLGKDFIIMKMLPSGVYHYNFIVDEQLRYAPDLPWERNDSGSAYNILDLQEYVHELYVQEYIPEAPENLCDFEPPTSPLSSYDNESLSDGDFGKPPPDLPPQLPITLLNKPSSSTVTNESLPRPQHTLLNHLYIQNSDGRLPVALGSTFRFRQKYVTVVLYKPSQR